MTKERYFKLVVSLVFIIGFILYLCFPFVLDAPKTNETRTVYNVLNVIIGLIAGFISVGITYLLTEWWNWIMR